MIAGNVLNRAFRLIKPQSISYRAFAGRVTNEIGLDVSEYADPVDIQASVQAVPRSTYEQLGLDFQKRYITIYTKAAIADLKRGVSGDMAEFDGKTYQAVSATDWMGMDGWQSILCVEVANA